MLRLNLGAVHSHTANGHSSHSLSPGLREERQVSSASVSFARWWVAPATPPQTCLARVHRLPDLALTPYL